MRSAARCFRLPLEMVVVAGLLCSCDQPAMKVPKPVEKDEAGPDLSQQLRYPDLPLVPNHRCPPRDYPAFEAFLREGAWDIHVSGNDESSAHGETPCEIQEAIRSAAAMRQHPERPLAIMVYAPATTPYRRIGNLIAGAAAQGIAEIRLKFRCSPEDFGRNEIRVLLPGTGVGNPPGKVDPLCVSIDPTGAVWLGSGDAKSMVDAASTGPGLPGLSDESRVYVVAAQAVGCDPLCSVSAAPAVSYQRVADVLSCLRDAGASELTLTADSPPDR